MRAGGARGTGAGDSRTTQTSNRRPHGRRGRATNGRKGSRPRFVMQSPWRVRVEPRRWFCRAINIASRRTIFAPCTTPGVSRRRRRACRAGATTPVRLRFCRSSATTKSWRSEVTPELGLCSITSTARCRRRSRTGARRMTSILPRTWPSRNPRRPHLHGCDMKPILLALLKVAAIVTSAQTPKSGMTDSEKIVDARRVGPRFIPNDATLLDRPSTPNGESRILLTGTHVCLPGSPRLPHDEPRRHCCPASS